jgi:hypothetical protein
LGGIGLVEPTRFPRHFIRYLCFFECARRFQPCLCESAMREIKNKITVRVTASSFRGREFLEAR